MASAIWAENHGLLLVDGVHPTAAGYTRLAQALAPVIAKAVRSQVADRGAALRTNDASPGRVT